MAIKNVVKVMNFHSLLRVDKSKKIANKYLVMEDELTNMIDHIVNNRNISLDYKALQTDSNKPVLNVYIGSDYGFCSSYNSQVNEVITKDKDGYKIVIGRKMRKNATNTIFSMTKEEFNADPSKVSAYLDEGLKESKYSEVNIIYNHYENASDIYLEKRKIYPIVSKKEGVTYTEDFVYETDIHVLLKGLITEYTKCLLSICSVNSNAAENVLRQNATQESLKRIDEQEEEFAKVERKNKKAKAFRKTIESFSKVRR